MMAFSYVYFIHLFNCRDCQPWMGLEWQIKLIKLEIPLQITVSLERYNFTLGEIHPFSFGHSADHKDKQAGQHSLSSASGIISKIPFWSAENKDFNTTLFAELRQSISALNVIFCFDKHKGEERERLTSWSEKTSFRNGYNSLSSSSCIFTNAACSQFCVSNLQVRHFRLL